MFIKQIYLVFLTLLTIVAMLVSIIWRYRYLTVLLLIVGAAVTFFLA